MHDYTPTSGFATIRVNLTTLSGQSQTLTFTFPAISTPGSDCTPHQ